MIELEDRIFNLFCFKLYRVVVGDLFSHFSAYVQFPVIGRFLVFECNNSTSVGIDCSVKERKNFFFSKFFFAIDEAMTMVALT